MSVDRSLLRDIPAVASLLGDSRIEKLGDQLSREARVALIREVVAEVRRAYLAGALEASALSGDAIIQRVEAEAAALSTPPLRRVINATGILIHTNLGRSPLSAGAQRAVSRILGGYANLEMDLATGKRTSRLSRVRDLLCRLTGAEDALAVNNNASAVYLALHVLAAGREVIVSRGELVEIGGSFRLPDVMKAGGAHLREVGTTNRTRITDYERAITEETALILKVHPSNFQITGYTEAVATGELARLAHDRGLLLFEDLGSGALEQHPVAYLPDEPRVQETLAAGADLVCFSGDKLLGGPQAGILLGSAELIGALRTHPLARVVRLDKLHLAALEATLVDYLAGEAGVERIPLYRMVLASTDDLRARGEDLVRQLTGRLPTPWTSRLEETQAALGGGTLPGRTVASVGLVVSAPDTSVEAPARRLREGRPAVVARIERDRLVFDLRTLLEEDWDEIAGLIVQAMEG